MTSTWEKYIPTPRSRFVQVICNECGNKQVIFDSAKTVVKCLVCGAVLAEPTGGKAHIIAKKERVLE